MTLVLAMVGANESPAAAPGTRVSGGGFWRAYVKTDVLRTTIRLDPLEQRFHFPIESWPIGPRLKEAVPDIVSDGSADEAMMSNPDWGGRQLPGDKAAQAAAFGRLP
jgi:hypothetical protein